MASMARIMSICHPAVADHQALEAQLPRKNRVQRQGCRRTRKNADDSDVTADAGRHQ